MAGIPMADRPKNLAIHPVSGGKGRRNGLTSKPLCEEMSQLIDNWVLIEARKR